MLAYFERTKEEASNLHIFPIFYNIKTFPQQLSSWSSWIFRFTLFHLILPGFENGAACRKMPLDAPSSPGKSVNWLNCSFWFWHRLTHCALLFFIFYCTLQEGTSPAQKNVTVFVHPGLPDLSDFSRNNAWLRCTASVYFVLHVMFGTLWNSSLNCRTALVLPNFMPPLAFSQWRFSFEGLTNMPVSPKWGGRSYK